MPQPGIQYERRASNLLKYRPLLMTYPLELILLDQLDRDNGVLPEGLLYDVVFPLAFVSKSNLNFIKLADRYDAFIEEMKYKHTLWTFIPKSVKDNVLLTTEAGKKRVEADPESIGSWKPSSYKPNMGS